MTGPTPWVVTEAGLEVRKHAPATLRNREAIATLLRDILPTAGLVLEIASGSGEHCAYLAGVFADLDWQPSDPDIGGRTSIAAWCDGLANVRPPLDLDAAARDWPIDRADAILCVNMVHISPWEATLGLLAGAGRLLSEGGPLILYGPYRRDGYSTAPSNEAFDDSLRSRDPRWGLRRVEDVIAAAREQGLILERIAEMPANNLTLMFHRS
ncbi:SAM-dependent methyltransferase [Sphingomonas sp. UYAg733]